MNYQEPEYRERAEANLATLPMTSAGTSVLRQPSANLSIMARKYRWRVVVTNGLDCTKVWVGLAASKEEAESKALADHPGWFVQNAERFVAL